MTVHSLVELYSFLFVLNILALSRAYARRGQRIILFDIQVFATPGDTESFLCADALDSKDGSWKTVPKLSGPRSMINVGNQPKRCDE